MYVARRRVRLSQGPQLPPLLHQEIRGGWLGRPVPFHPLDFLGVGLGTFFLWRSWRDGRTLGMALGALMIAIHSVRFFYAPTDPEKLHRLVESVGLRWEDLCREELGR